MNKTDYILLKDKYFDALTSKEEEAALKAYLATTDDSDFDELKAVMGYFATGKAIYHPHRTSGKLVPALAAAAAIAIATFTGVRLYQASNNRQAIARMESTLTEIFSSGTDIESELNDIFTPTI